MTARRLPIVLAAACALGRAHAQAPVPAPVPAPVLQSERPAHFRPVQAGFDYAPRHVDIPMRDGVKLHAVILVPNGATRAPILLTRTPYDAEALTANRHSAHLVAMLDGYDNASDIESSGGYIRVVEDVRGKYGSGGDYVMNRPWQGKLNPTAIDHSTDTWDTIEWLVHNVPQTNGRVGMLGISYDGFTTLMGLIHPHPALRAAVPMNPMVDGWMGDDWFHRGAFRAANLSYIYEQEATRDNTAKWWETHYDDYAMYLAAGSVGELARTHGLDQMGFYRKLVAHPAYDSFWQDQAVDRKLAGEPLGVPTLLVHSLWDQEDIYGDIAIYKAIKPKDTSNDRVFLAMGPWHHGGEIHDGSTMGAVHFDSDTALWFRLHVLRPFLDHFLKDGAPPLGIAPVTAFESGTNEWRRLPAWPAGCAVGCAIAPQRLFLLPDASLSLGTPGATQGVLDYVADPAKPVPYHPLPIHYDDDDALNFWHDWLAEDQRPASTRTDVLTFATPVLTRPVKIAGEPVADLLAATTGQDGDFVVKVIDAYPDEVPIRPAMAGYQLMIAADIMRGRYRESLSEPHPIPPGQRLRYRWALPTANHVFLPGHRIMVQIQSSWFPLYDRNPQTFVPNIFLARPGDFRKATVSIVAGGAQGSFVELPVVSGQAAGE